MVGDDKVGTPQGIGDFTAISEYLSSLCFRFVGGSLAQESGPRAT